jgi:hypothetical protein
MWAGFCIMLHKNAYYACPVMLSPADLYGKTVLVYISRCIFQRNLMAISIRRLPVTSNNNILYSLSSCVHVAMELVTVWGTTLTYMKVQLVSQVLSVSLNISFQAHRVLVFG